MIIIAMNLHSGPNQKSRTHGEDCVGSPGGNQIPISHGEAQGKIWNACSQLHPLPQQADPYHLQHCMLFEQFFCDTFVNDLSCPDDQALSCADTCSRSCRTNNVLAIDTTLRFLKC